MFENYSSTILFINYSPVLHYNMYLIIIYFLILLVINKPKNNLLLYSTTSVIDLLFIFINNFVILPITCRNNILN